MHGGGRGSSSVHLPVLARSPAGPSILVGCKSENASPRTHSYIRSASLFEEGSQKPFLQVCLLQGTSMGINSLLCRVARLCCESYPEQLMSMEWNCVQDVHVLAVNL